METLDSRLGRNVEGASQRPRLTLSGQPISTEHPASTRVLGGGWYVALDDFAPPGFDEEAAVMELKRTIMADGSEPRTTRRAATTADADMPASEVPDVPQS